MPLLPETQILLQKMTMQEQIKFKAFTSDEEIVLITCYINAA